MFRGSWDHGKTGMFAAFLREHRFGPSLPIHSCVVSAKKPANCSAFGAARLCNELVIYLAVYRSGWRWRAMVYVECPRSLPRKPTLPFQQETKGRQESTILTSRQQTVRAAGAIAIPVLKIQQHRVSTLQCLDLQRETEQEERMIRTGIS